MGRFKRAWVNSDTFIVTLLKIYISVIDAPRKRYRFICTTTRFSVLIDRYFDAASGAYLCYNSARATPFFLHFVSFIFDVSALPAISFILSIINNL